MGGGHSSLGNIANVVTNPIGSIAAPLTKNIPILGGINKTVTQLPGNIIGGNITGNSGIAGDLKGVMSTMPVGGGVAGSSPNINVPPPTAPNYAGDQQQIQQLQNQMNQLYSNQIPQIQKTYQDQSVAEKSQIDQQVKDMITNLTSGPQGEQLRQSYNNMGLLNSGAFQQGLAQQFAPIEQNAVNDVLTQNEQKFGDIRSLMSSQLGTNLDLGQAGTQRQFSLEDWYNNAIQNANLAQAGANLQVQTGNQNSQNQLFGGLLGATGALGSAAILAK